MQNGTSPAGEPSGLLGSIGAQAGNPHRPTATHSSGMAPTLPGLGNSLPLRSRIPYPHLIQSCPPPLRALSEKLFHVLQKNLPLESVMGQHSSGNGKRWEMKRINRTMHVNAAELLSVKVRGKYEPDLHVARLIVSCFENECTSYPTASSRDFEWAFWKPILAYAMTLECEKTFVLDQLVQVIFRIQQQSPPRVLDGDFYLNLRGLENAWDTYECFAPLAPPPYQRRGFSSNYPNIHENWHHSHFTSSAERVLRTLPFEDDPGFRNLRESTSSNGVAEVPTAKYMTHHNWRNLNEFIARLYAVKIRLAGEKWQSERFGNVTSQHGWWLWKGFYALIETFEDQGLGMLDNDRNTACSVALTWLSYHGMNLRNTDFVEGMRQYTRSCEALLSDPRLRELPIATEITLARKPNAVGSMLPFTWRDFIPNRWSMWLKHIDELRSMVPLESVESVEDTLIVKLTHALYGQLRNVLVDHVAKERLRGPADDELERVAVNSKEWKYETDEAFKTQWNRLRWETQPRWRDSAAQELRKCIGEQFRQRLYRQDTEQQWLYPVYELNAVRRKFLHLEGDMWRWNMDAATQDAADLSWCTLHQPEGEATHPRVFAELLGVRYEADDTMQHVLERYWAPHVAAFLEDMRKPLFGS